MQRLLYFSFLLLFVSPLISQQNSSEWVIGSSAGYSIQGQTKSYDLDHDGDLDILTISGMGSVAWYENLGSELFSERLGIADSLGQLGDVLAADLDGDDDLDILFSSRIEDAIIWIPGNGEGAFGSPQIIFELLDGPESIDVADLNGDGALDILVAAIFGNEVSFFLNTGSGTFLSPTSINLSAEQANSVRAADMDGDGDPDVVYAIKAESRVVWHENLGNAVFGALIEIVDQTSSVGDILVQDLDGDNDMDVAIPYYDLDRVRILYNNGDGSFQPPSDLDYLNNPWEINASDFNGDGLPDLLAVSNGDDLMVWYPNLGGGQYGDHLVLESTDDYSQFIWGGDLNGDGSNDCLYVSDAKIKYRMGNSDGTFETSRVVSPNIDFVTDLLAIDYNQDGLQDLLITTNDDEVGLFKGTEFGLFDFETLGPEPTFVKALDVGDVDNDGDLDIALCVQYDTGLIWYENTGDGEVVIHEVGANNDQAMHDVQLADLDQDGLLDIVTATTTVHKLAWFRNLGGGNFSDELIVDTDIQGIRSVHVSDINEDGFLDLFTTGSEDLQYFLNDGTGVFTAQSDLSSDFPPSFVLRTGDLDNDGDLDVIAASSQFNDPKVVWFENLGDGTFADEVLLTDVIHNIKSLELLDQNEDGFLDLFFTSSASPLVYSLLSDGLGDFSSVEQSYSGDADILQMTLSDMNNDAIEDVVIATLDGQLLALDGSAHLGCTDLAACNYSDVASEDDGSCCYDCACLDPNASNYVDDATCGGGTCTYLLEGFVFHDENQNGVFDATEEALAFQSGTVQPTNQVYVTDDEGAFQIVVPGPGTYLLDVSGSESYPFPTTTNPLEVEVGFQNTSALHFGLSNTQPTFLIDVYLYPEGSNYPCDDWVFQNLCFKNNGNQPIDVVLQWSLDALFQSFETDLVPDSIVDGLYFYSFSAVEPGEIVCETFHLQSPTVDAIGEMIHTAAEATGYWDGEVVAFGADDKSLLQACAYDPNDKQVFPVGYSESHYVQDGEALEYLIRFQNTGNAPATDIHVLDTLDMSLDIDKFELLTYSHSVNTTIDLNTRVVDFFFEDIQLPDSVNNEPESHGFVSFKIDHIAGLPLLTEINNTADIYFDNNPPIITNTTWSTTYDCSLFEASFTYEEGVLTASEGDSYQWYLNGNPIPNATEPTWEVTEDGSYAVAVMLDFPCSVFSSEGFFTSTDNLGNASGFSLYPNPTSGFTTLDLGADYATVSEVRLIDAQGKTIATQRPTSSKMTLYYTQMRAGLYQVVLLGTSKTVVLPLVVTE